MCTFNPTHKLISGSFVLLTVMTTLHHQISGQHIQKLIYYEQRNWTGGTQEESAEIHCMNIQRSRHFTVRSVDTQGSCVMFCSEKNCVNCIRISPENKEEGNSDQFAFYDVSRRICPR